MKKIKYKVAFASFLFIGLFLIQKIGIYFALSIPVLLVLYIILIKTLYKFKK